MLCPYPITFKKTLKNGSQKMLSVPCQKCAACKEAKRTDWAIRLREESDGIPSLFITFTYSDQNLPLNGENNGCVLKRDVQLYMKRLRKALAPRKIKYFFVGEYGTQTYRPHYHAMMFNVNWDDIYEIEKAWTNKNGEPYGNVVFRDFHMARAMYVAKYHIIKTHYPVGCTRPFMICSKNLGKSYIEKLGKWHRKNIDRCYYTLDGSQLRLPRYYKERIYNKNQRERIADKIKNSIDTIPEAELQKHKEKYGYKSHYFLTQKDRILNRERLFTEKNKKSQL